MGCGSRMGEGSVQRLSMSHTKWQWAINRIAKRRAVSECRKEWVGEAGGWWWGWERECNAINHDWIMNQLCDSTADVYIWYKQNFDINGHSAQRGVYVMYDITHTQRLHACKIEYYFRLHFAKLPIVHCGAEYSISQGSSAISKYAYMYVYNIG